MNDKLKKLLGSFDERQIAEINRFLNSADGQKFKNSISEKDKQSLLSRLDSVDAEKVKRAFSGLSKDDIKKMLRQRK